MTDSLIDLGLTLACETCESAIELGTDPAEGVCRQCGLAFLLEPDLIGAEPTTDILAS